MSDGRKQPVLVERDIAFALLCAAIAGTLVYLFSAFRRFDGVVSLSPIACVAGGVALGLSGFRIESPKYLRVLALTLGAVGLAGGLALLIRDGTATARATFWLASGLSCTPVLATGLLRAGAKPDGRALHEALRLVLLLGIALWAGSSFHRIHPIGAGDAHWYTLMLADFVGQIRLGQFPVWLGGTEYAFNGTFSPLRLAPWFQHVGGALDLLTMRSLEPAALKNLIISLNLLLIGASAYSNLRLLLSDRPWLAANLAVLLVLSPATLGPGLMGDQYMTFVALPFLSFVAAGLWQLQQPSADRAGIRLGVGLGGLWLAHPPVAFWTSGVALCAVAANAIFRPRRFFLKSALFSGALAIALGSYAIHSARSLDNVSTLTPSGAVAAAQMAQAFPAMFGWLSSGLRETSDYQIGLSAQLLLLFATLGWIRNRTWSPAILAWPTFLVLALLVPIPFVSERFWEHLPGVVLQATNVWPTQRLLPIWLVFVVFFSAAVLGRSEPGVGARRWILLMALMLSAWSLHQAGRLVKSSHQPIEVGIASRRQYENHNLTLTRYAFSPFAKPPPYFSHGYMDPALEHSLLRPDGTVVTRNSWSTVGRSGFSQFDRHSRRLESGVWKAVNDNGSIYYPLTPELKLPAGVSLALYLEPLAPGDRGILQLIAPRLFREYELPDSGIGISSSPDYSTRSFGTLPTSSRVIPLLNPGRGEVSLASTVLAPDRQLAPAYDFANFELWSYDPNQLPIVVKSWVPYRVISDSPEPGLLETPRVWQEGYRARVNGVTVPAVRTADNLVSFPVPQGHADVTIKFVPGIGLEFHYWTTLLAWIGVLICGVRRVFSANNPVSASEREL